MAKYELTSPTGEKYQIDAPDDASEQQVMAYFQANMPKAPEPELSMSEKGVGGIRSVMQGAGFGTSDEIEGALRGIGYGLGAGISGREPVLNAAYRGYEEGKKSAQQEQARFVKENPKSNFLLETSASLASPLVPKGINYIKEASGPLGQILRSAKIGSISGGAYGLGTAEDDNRIAGLGVGALGGGLLAGGLSGAGGALSPFVAKQTQKISNMIKGVKNIPATAAQRKLLERITQDQLDIPAIKQMLANAGEGATIADVGGKNVRGLAQALASMPGQASELAAQNLGAPRSAGMGQRLIDAARSGLGDVSGDIYKTSEDLLAARSRAAKPLYEAATATAVDPTALAPVLDDPFLRDMFRQVQGNKLYGLQNEGSNSIAVMDAVKKNLDDMIEAAKRTGENNKARVLMQKRDVVTGIADEAAPVYAEARAAWESPSRSIEALQAGRNFMKGDTEALQQVVGKLSPQDINFYRQGVMREIQGMVEGGKDGLSSVRTRLSTPAAKAKLAEVFPENGLNSFIKALDAETLKREAANKILGGSQTAERLANQLDTAVDPSGVIANLLQGNVKGAAVSAATDYAQKVVSGVTRMPEASRNELGQMLFSNNPAEQAKALNALQINVQSKADLQKLVGQIRNVWSALVVPQTSGMLGGGLLTDNR